MFNVHFNRVFYRERVMRQSGKIFLSVLALAISSSLYAEYDGSNSGTTSAATATPESAYTDDATIADTINSKFSVNSRLNNYRLSATVNHGVATISGRVDTTQQANQAVHVAGSVNGVMSVRSKIVIGKPN